ncbi:MAG: hypothetical protein H7145_13505 [Akkermansiaceae bacterium]|nr:hypothetical protein [Armatimonadota bacterium]
MIDADDISRIVETLPEANRSGSSFEVNRRGFAWFYQEKVEGRRGRIEHPDVLAVRVADLTEKEILIAMDPEKFFTDAHYKGYPAVLVRLATIDTDDLTDLLSNAWRTRAPRRLVAEFDARANASA